MKFPISSAVICSPASDQQAAVAASRRTQMPPDRVAFEESAEGLIVHGLTELDLELAVDELRKSVPSVRQGKPRVAYDMGPPLMEPYYRATVDVPEENVGAVIGDITSRRAKILLERAGPLGRQLVAEIPVSECFGYFTALRMLTQRRGTYAVEYAGYRLAPYNGPGANDAA